MSKSVPYDYIIGILIKKVVLEKPVIPVDPSLPVIIIDPYSDLDIIDSEAGYNTFTLFRQCAFTHIAGDGDVRVLRGI